MSHVFSHSWESGRIRGGELRNWGWKDFSWCWQRFGVLENFSANAHRVRLSTSCGRNGLGGLVRHPEGGGKLRGRKWGVLLVHQQMWCIS